MITPSPLLVNGFIAITSRHGDILHVKADQKQAIQDAIDHDLEWLFFTDVFGGEHRMRPAMVTEIATVSAEAYATYCEHEGDVRRWNRRPHAEDCEEGEEDDDED